LLILKRISDFWVFGLGSCLFLPQVVNMESEVKGGRQVSAERVLSFIKSECNDLPLDLNSLEAAAAKNM
jgi:hypothetical protein